MRHHPFWLDRVPARRRPSYPRFRGEIDVPVVIVGGGLTGCACAVTFATAGVRAIVLEADRIGAGSTAGSARRGNLLCESISLPSGVVFTRGPSTPGPKLHSIVTIGPPAGPCPDFRMALYDVFNGDADGICALQQLRLARPARSRLGATGYCVAS